MISYWNVFVICIAVAVIAIETSGHVFKPELHFSWWTIVGWVLFILSILAWEFGKK